MVVVVAVVGVVVLVVLVGSDPVGVGERDVSQDLMRVCWLRLRLDAAVPRVGGIVWYDEKGMNE